MTLHKKIFSLSQLDYTISFSNGTKPISCETRALTCGFYLRHSFAGFAGLSLMLIMFEYASRKDLYTENTQEFTPRERELPFQYMYLQTESPFRKTRARYGFLTGFDIQAVYNDQLLLTALFIDDTSRQTKEMRLYLSKRGTNSLLFVCDDEVVAYSYPTSFWYPDRQIVVAGGVDRGLILAMVLCLDIPNAQ